MMMMSVLGHGHAQTVGMSLSKLGCPKDVLLSSELFINFTLGKADSPSQGILNIINNFLSFFFPSKQGNFV